MITVVKTMVDYYKVLGVSPDAPRKDIENAWRKKMRKAHPDMGGSEDEAQLLNEAYKVLSDESARAEYDASRKPAWSSYEDDGASADPVVSAPAEGVVPERAAAGVDLGGAALGVAYESARAVGAWVRWVFIILSFFVLMFVTFGIVMPVGDLLAQSGNVVAGDVVKTVGLLVAWGAVPLFVWRRYARRNPVRESGGFRVRRVRDDGSVELFKVQRG